MTELRDKFDEDLKHFFNCINWGKSALDGDAIAFMNEIGRRIDELVEEGKNGKA